MVSPITVWSYCSQTQLFSELFGLNNIFLSESIILVALIYFFSKENELNAVILSSTSLVFSLLISYLRARLEGLGYNSKSGFFTRPERDLVVSIGLILFSPNFTVTVLALASLLGLAHRFIVFWRILN